MRKRTIKIFMAIVICFACAATQLTAQIQVAGKNASPANAYSAKPHLAGNNPSIFAKISGLDFRQAVLKANCSSSASAFFAPEAACNGANVTPIQFIKANRTVVPNGVAGSNGTANTVGVVYRYVGAGTAPDGTVIDALVKIESYNNNQDPTPATYTDDDLTSPGFDENLQPSLSHGSNLNNSNPATNWTGNMTYYIRFVRTGTITPVVISVAATTVDNDGSGKCGGLREYVTYSAFNQSLISDNSNQTINTNTNTITGPATIQTDIALGADYANAALFVNVSEFRWTQGFTTETRTCTRGTASEVRYGSLNLTCQVNFNKSFASTTLSGSVYNDVDGLTNNSINSYFVNGTTTTASKTNASGLFVNLVNTVNSSDYVVSSVAIPASGIYSFPTVFSGNYKVQISNVQGAESSLAPAKTLPAGWVNTGEFLGTGAGNDGSANAALRADGLLAVTVASTAITNANFGIEQLPTANNNNAVSRANLGGTNSSPVAAGTFSGSDTSPGTVTSIKITAFPTNAKSITIGATTYYINAGAIPQGCVGCQAFPSAGVTVLTNTSGNPTTATAISVDPAPNGATTVAIPYRTIDNANVESLAATASVPFTAAPTAANVTVSGNLYFNGSPLRNVIVTLIDGETNTKDYARTNANGAYSFEKEAGKTYVVQPLSGKYKFAPSNKVINLNNNLTDVDFLLSSKNYRPKNDFDGDGKSDVAVYRQTEGNWYILNSGSEEMRVVKFGVETDVPVSGDFDGDGKTDVAIYRPSEGNWYILGSSDEKPRVERFGLADDKLVPADFDGDGKTDVAIYRNGFWYISRSSDGTVAVQKFGLESDVPVAADYDADGKADVAVYRPSEGVWYVFGSANGKLSAFNFGLEKDIPIAADYDGDGAIDIAQFRDNFWYIQKSVEGFTVSQFGTDGDQQIVGDYDGDGRADQTLFNDGIWTIQNSDNGSVRQINFGLPTDIPIG